MKNLASFNKLVNLVTTTGNLSKSIFRIHELAIHQLNLEEFSDEDQGCLYFLYATGKAVKKIEKKAIKQNLSISEIDNTKLVDLITSDEGQLSNSLVVCHNLICHRIDLVHFTAKVQNSLFYVFETSKLIQEMEQEIKVANIGEIRFG